MTLVATWVLKCPPKVAKDTKVTPTKKAQLNKKVRKLPERGVFIFLCVRLYSRSQFEKTE